MAVRSRAPAMTAEVTRAELDAATRPPFCRSNSLGIPGPGANRIGCTGPVVVARAYRGAATGPLSSAHPGSPATVAPTWKPAVLSAHSEAQKSVCPRVRSMGPKDVEAGLAGGIGMDVAGHSDPPPGDPAGRACTGQWGRRSLRLQIHKPRPPLRGRWEAAGRAVIVPLSVHGLPTAWIAAFLECAPGTVQTLDHPFSTWAGWTPRPAPQRAIPFGRAAVTGTDRLVDRLAAGTARGRGRYGGSGNT